MPGNGNTMDDDFPAGAKGPRDVQGINRLYTSQSTVASFLVTYAG